MIAAPPKSAIAKDLGAFYTPARVAEFLIHWATRSANDTILDPSFGGGIFLKAAAERLSELGGSPEISVFGAELDTESFHVTASAVKAFGVLRPNLYQGNFFSIAAGIARRFTAVVGNPPFIRYQQFNGEVRASAAALLRKEGVRIPELASSWAPFIVASAGLLEQGGRLAMVVPMELCHATYGIPILAFLARSFRSVQFLSFEERLFPDLSQETLLLLADDRGAHDAKLLWKHLRDVKALRRVEVAGGRIPGATRLDSAAISSGQRRLVEQFLPKKARELYAHLRRHPRVSMLQTIADVGIGYVTGANDFFHLSPDAARDLAIPQECLRPAVCRGRALVGLRLTRQDWDAACRNGDASYLLSLEGRRNLPRAVEDYIRAGEKRGVHKAYKCRVRHPWYIVPHVHKADAFLTYMSGQAPRLVVNEAEAVAPNTLHVVRSLPLLPVPAHQLAIGWQTSLTELSTELEGHAMGGGLLKLEPKEAGRVLVALPDPGTSRDVCASLDVIARHGRIGTVRETVDRMILRERVGLTEDECRCLQAAANKLRARRYRRTTPES